MKKSGAPYFHIYNLLIFNLPIMLISAGEIIKSSWELYKKNWKHFTAYVLLLILPSLLLGALTAGLSVLSFIYFSNNTILNVALLLAVIAAAVVFALWISIGLAQAIKARLNNQELPTFRSMLGSTSHLIWPVILTSLLISLVVLGGILLFVIPGIIFMVWYSFTYYTVIFDGQRGTNALRASKSLVVGRWWQMIWRMFAPIFLFNLIGWVISVIISLPFEFFLSEQANEIAFQISSGVVNIVITPLMAASSVILYSSAKENPLTSSSHQPAK